MKRFIFIFLFFYFINYTFSQNPQFEWVRGYSGTGSTYGLSIALDSESNIYIIGEFMGEIDFDPGINENNISSNGLQDVFISKLDSSGNFLWVKIFGGIGNEKGNSITTDEYGNIYATGAFNGSVDFDPGPQSNILSSNGGYDIFILKLDSSGDLQWVKGIGGSYVGFLEGDVGLSMNVDDSLNVLITGFYVANVDFDPSLDTYFMNANGLQDVFILKLDQDGCFVWARRIGGNSTDQGKSVITDSSGNIFITGYFLGQIEYLINTDTFTLTSNGYQDIFLAKFNPTGELLWINGIGGSLAEEANDIAIDYCEDIYISGFTRNIYKLDSDHNSKQEFSNILVSKFNNEGDQSWSKNFGGNNNDVSYALTVDINKHIYLAGMFMDTVIFDSNIPKLISNGYRDVFLSKLDSNGNVLWATSFGAYSIDASHSIVLDDNQNLYSTGIFYGDVEISSVECDSILSTSSNGAFILKMDQSFANDLIFEPTEDKPIINVFPNPAINKVHVLIPNNKKYKSKSIELISATGSLIMQEQIANKRFFSINISNIQSGIYYFRVEWIDETYSITSFIKL